MSLCAAMARRAVLAGLAGALCVPTLPAVAAAAAGGRPIAALYKRETTTARPRLDAAVQNAVVALEQEMTARGLSVVQPDASVYALIDQGTGVPITFAADAGLTIFFSAESGVRPSAAPGRVFTEMRLIGRLMLHRRVLASVRADGRAEALAGSESSGYELAAARAAKSFAEQIEAAIPPVPAVAPPSTPTVAASTSSGAMQAPTPAAKRPIRPPGETLPRPTRVWALLVGIADFSHLRAAGLNVPDLPPIRNDIALMRAALARLGATPDTVRVLAESDATSVRMRAALADLATKMAPSDLTVVYLSSHGILKDGGSSTLGLPVLYDHDPAHVQSALDFAEMQALIERLPTRQSLWIVDTCHAGGATTNTRIIEVGAGSASISAKAAGTSFDPAEVRRQANKDQDLAVLSASLPDQKSLALPGNSVFTGILVDGLESMQGGEAPIGKMFAERIYERVVERTYKRQTPMLGVVGLGEYIRF